MMSDSARDKALSDNKLERKGDPLSAALVQATKDPGSLAKSVPSPCRACGHRAGCGNWCCHPPNHPCEPVYKCHAP